MALQGTLDTFALPDVLHLLGTTKKTGCLRLEGGRGSGTVHVEGGEVVAVAATHAPLATDPAEALFELLRFEEGAFAFETDAVPADPRPAADVASVLAEATALLQEWREIEAVVPSLDVHVALRPALEGAEVTIPADQWAHIVAVGPGRTVRALGDHLELAELPVSRVVRDLLELGVVQLEERAPEPRREVPGALSGPDGDDADRLRPDIAAPVTGAAHAGEADGEEARPAGRPIVAARGTDEPDGAGVLPAARPIRARRARPRLIESSTEPERFVPLDLPGHLAAPAGEDAPTDLDDLTAAFPGLSSRSDPSPAEDAAVDEQLMAQSPDVADAADDPTETAVAAALDEAAEGDGAPVNRGLLLKFLGSAKA